MEALHTRFAAGLTTLGLSAPGPDFGSAVPAALEIPIGGEEKIYLADHRRPNGVYIENALERALALARAVSPTLLRIDPEEPENITSGVLHRLGLPAPEEQFRDQLYWQIPADPDFLRKLFREIIRSELSAEGLEFLCGSVFLLREQEPLLYCLRDDRSAVLGAASPEALSPFETRFSRL